jgi:hypothetical protein
VNSKQRGARRRKRGWLLGGLLGLTAGMFLFCSFPCFEPFYASLLPDLWSERNPTVSRFNPRPQPFDQGKWQRGYATDRIAMAKWLKKSGTLNGLQRDQVTAMLGPPDFEHNYDGEPHLSWHLGRIADNSLFDRTADLTLHLDDTGKVVEADVFYDD